MSDGGEAGGETGVAEMDIAVEAMDNNEFGMHHLLEPGVFAEGQKYSYENHRITQTLRGLGIDPNSLGPRERALVHRALMDGNFMADPEAGRGLALARFRSTYALSDAVTLTHAEVMEREAALHTTWDEVAAMPDHERQQLQHTANNLVSLVGEVERFDGQGASEQEYSALWGRFHETTPQTGTVNQLFHIARPQERAMTRAVSGGLAGLAASAVVGLADIDISQYNLGENIVQGNWVAQPDAVIGSHTAALMQQKTQAMRTQNPFSMS